MGTRIVSYKVILAAIIGVMALVSAPLAQNKAQAGKSSTDVQKTPRTADGHPDLNGFWNYSVPGLPDYRTDLDNAPNLVRAADGSIFFNYGEGNKPNSPLAGKDGTAGRHGDRKGPSYKPEYLAKVKELATHDYGGTNFADPLMECKPAGVPRASIAGDTGGIQILQTAQAIGILYEEAPGPVYRLIYMDGRAHPKDLDTSYMGHSIGHWEGDTLVVDVVGLNDETWLGGGQGIGSLQSIHSDKEHVIERWTREGNDLLYEATVEDPVMFTQPWVITPRRTTLAPQGDYIQPEMCVITPDKAHYPTGVNPDNGKPGNRAKESAE